MKLIFIISLLFIFCFLPVHVFSQKNGVNGIVYDKVSKKPLPFVHVVYNAKKQGITTDVDGKFNIGEISRIEFLQFSYIGYKSKIFDKQSIKNQTQFAVFLEEDTYGLHEVIIYPGENPAHRIINKVLENRGINNPEELASYSCSSYNKMVFTVDFGQSQDSAKVDSFALKAKEVLESQYLLIMESLSERNYKKPGKINEKVIASKVSGLKEPSFVMLASQMQSFSFYNEMITLLDSRYISPISTGSTKRYFFQIEDTSYTAEGDTVFSISFRPNQNRNYEGLKGILNINTYKYAIQSVVAEPVESNGIADLSIIQNYTMVDGHWFPSELHTEIIFINLLDAVANKQRFKFKGIGKTYFSNIKINPNFSDLKFDAIELEVNDKAFKQNDSIWAKLRFDSLSNKELKTYHVIDSIGEAENLDFKLKVMKSVISGYIPYYFIDIKILSIFGGNEFEGFRPGLGFRTNEKISKEFSFGAYGAYGFNDIRWKYGANLDFYLSKRKELQLGINYKNDVIESSGLNFTSDNQGLNSDELYREYLIKDMTYIEEYQFNFGFKLLKKIKLNLFARIAEMTNTSGYQFYNGFGFEPVNHGFNQQEAGVQLKFAPNENLAFMADELFSLNPYHSPILYLNLIRGFKNVSSDFDYIKIEAKLNFNFMTKAFGRTNLQIIAGKVFGDLPYFMLYNGHENYSDFGMESSNSFATMRMNEFLSDKFISLFYRQDFGSLLFKGKKFKPKLIFINSIGIGSLDKPELHSNLEFKSLEKGFCETGLLINNIIRQYKIIGLGFGIYYRYGAYSFSNISDNFAYKLSLTFEL